MPFILLLTPVFATLLGGLLAIRFRKSLVLLSALGAGLLIGAAFLDLLPEALALGKSVQGHQADVLGIALLAFLGFFSLQSVIDSVAARWEGSAQALGKLSGALLLFHSLRDGMAIGLSYAASHPAGYAVAVGIAAHDLGDGMSVVILTSRGRKAGWGVYAFLAADALAPLLGGLLTVWWTFSLRSSVVLLAVASGFFIQVATGDFLQEVRQDRASRRFLTPAVLAGAGLIYAANFLTGSLR